MSARCKLLDVIAFADIRRCIATSVDDVEEVRTENRCERGQSEGYRGDHDFLDVEARPALVFLGVGRCT
jgi:hypothetical protein